MTAAAYPLNFMCLHWEDYEDLQIHEIKRWKYTVCHRIAITILIAVLLIYTHN